MPSRPMTTSNRLRFRGDQLNADLLVVTASMAAMPGGESGWNGVAATQNASKLALVAG